MSSSGPRPSPPSSGCSVVRKPSPAGAASRWQDIVEGKTGFVCKPRDSVDMARTIEDYFDSDFFKSLDQRRKEIRNYANTRHSWEVVATMTRDVYRRLCTKAL